MSNSENKATKPAALITRALSSLLRPLVKLLVHHQVTYPMLSELLKSVYVDVARADFKLKNKRITDSRISVLTGVHRKDVRKFRAIQATEIVETNTVSLGTQLISIWLTDPLYLDGKGNPKPLPRVSHDSSQEDFSSLVHLVGRQDIHPRSVLDDWLRLGVVQLNDKEEVELLNQAFVPKKGFEEKIYFFKQNIHDHLGAVTNNLLDDEGPMLEQSVYHSGLSEQSAEELHQIARRLTASVLREIDKKARALKQKDSLSEEAQGSFRVNYGSYFYKEATKEDGVPND